MNTLTLITLLIIIVIAVALGYFARKRTVEKLTKEITLQERSKIIESITRASWWYSEDDITLCAVQSLVEQINKYGTAYHDQFNPREVWRNKLMECGKDRGVLTSLTNVWQPITCKPSKAGTYVCMMVSGNVGFIVFDGVWQYPESLHNDKITAWIEVPTSIN